jgi:hypothetical protein
VERVDVARSRGGVLSAPPTALRPTYIAGVVETRGSQREPGWATVDMWTGLPEPVAVAGATMGGLVAFQGRRLHLGLGERLAVTRLIERVVAAVDGTDRRRTRTENAAPDFTANARADPSSKAGRTASIAFCASMRLVRASSLKRAPRALNTSVREARARLGPSRRISRRSKLPGRIERSPADPKSVGRNGETRPLTRRTVRCRFLRQHINLDGKRILEVGALDDPMFPQADGLRVRYLDWFSRDELVARHPNRTGIVNVDYAVKSKRFADAVAGQFDLIVANHVIEHIPDPITWLQQLSALAFPGGCLFLSVPDKRFTFDYLRQPSTIVQLLRAHEEDLERADVWQVLDARLFHRPLKIGDFANGCPPREKLVGRRSDLRCALESARKAATNSYANVHCFVYTPYSFEHILECLHEVAFIPWRIAAIADTQTGMNEFHVLLRRD